MTLVAYGGPIIVALRDPKTKLSELKVLRDHAAAVIAAQGDLKGALRKLESEIKKRDRAAKKKSK